MTTAEFNRQNTTEQINTLAKFVLKFIDSESAGCFTPQNILAALLAFGDEVAIVPQRIEDAVSNNFGF